MEYMKLVQRSVANAWKCKTLWLFGFFVSATDWLEGALDLDKESFKNGGQLGEWGELEGIHIEPAVWVYLSLLAVSMLIVFWFMSVLSEGALVFGIYRNEMKQSMTFSECWTTGLRKFLRLFGIMLLATLLIVACVFSLIIYIVPAFIVSVFLGVGLLLLAIPALIVVIFVAIAVEGWAIRYAVLDDERWSDAIRKGWGLLRNNVRKTIGVAFSSFFAQLVFYCAILVILLILAIPFVIMGFSLLWPALISGGCVALVVIVFFSGFLGTFASSMWTLGFMQMTGKGE